jgi:hypothetical protein
LPGSLVWESSDSDPGFFVPFSRTISLFEKVRFARKKILFEISAKTNRRNLKFGPLAQFFTLNKNTPTKNTKSLKKRTISLILLRRELRHGHGHGHGHCYNCNYSRQARARARAKYLKKISDVNPSFSPPLLLCASPLSIMPDQRVLNKTPKKIFCLHLAEPRSDRLKSSLQQICKFH